MKKVLIFLAFLLLISLFSVTIVSNNTSDSIVTESEVIDQEFEDLFKNELYEALLDAHDGDSTQVPSNLF